MVLGGKGATASPFFQRMTVFFFAKISCKTKTNSLQIPRSSNRLLDFQVKYTFRKIKNRIWYAQFLENLCSKCHKKIVLSED